MVRNQAEKPDSCQNFDRPRYRRLSLRRYATAFGQRNRFYRLTCGSEIVRKLAVRNFSPFVETIDWNQTRRFINAAGVPGFDRPAERALRHPSSLNSRNLSQGISVSIFRRHRGFNSESNPSPSQKPSIMPEERADNRLCVLH